MCTSVNFLFLFLLFSGLTSLLIPFDESPFVVTFIKKHFSIPSESRQVSSSFSCLATCFYTAYCSTSVSNTSLKC